MSVPIYVDVETSGLSVRDGYVLQIGAVATNGDSVIDSFSEICYPGDGVLMNPGLDDALAVNGLTREEISAARHVEFVAIDFLAWLRQFGPSVLHSYNVAFDSAFLAERPWQISKLAWGACIMKTIANGNRWSKLTAVAERFGLAWEGTAHSALADAKMAHKVHRAYLKHNGLVGV